MNYNKLVSIIIPMFNVERFIAKCVKSVMEQTYLNIEIILIDDGSPDKSGDIVEEFSKVDNRIKLIRTENRGVSSARNLGIAQSSGEYLVFVDGDDYLSPDYVDYMMKLASDSCADFIMSRNCRLFPSEEKQDTDCDGVEIWSPEKAASELLYPGRIEIGCWNKLFRKEFLISNDIKFPITLFMGEGLCFIVNAAQKANKICVGSKKVYNYRKDNQQSATTITNIPKYFNALSALDYIDENKVIESDDFELSLIYHKYMTTYIALHTIYSMKKEREYRKQISEYLYFLRNNYIKFLVGDFNFITKAKVFLFILSPDLAFKVISLIKTVLFYKKNNSNLR
ncbi:glycosyltransferase family 2 protein [Kluyvera sichuanensis]